MSSVISVILVDRSLSGSLSWENFCQVQFGYNVVVLLKILICNLSNKVPSVTDDLVLSRVVLG